MTAEERLWAIALAVLCAASVAGYAGSGSPLSAGTATFSALIFFALVIDGGRKR